MRLIRWYCQIFRSYFQSLNNLNFLVCPQIIFLLPILPTIEVGNRYCEFSQFFWKFPLSLLCCRFIFACLCIASPIEGLFLTLLFWIQHHMHELHVFPYFQGLYVLHVHNDLSDLLYDLNIDENGLNYFHNFLAFQEFLT